MSSPVSTRQLLLKRLKFSILHQMCLSSGTLAYFLSTSQGQEILSFSYQVSDTESCHGQMWPCLGPAVIEMFFQCCFSLTLATWPTSKFKWCQVKIRRLHLATKPPSNSNTVTLGRNLIQKIIQLHPDRLPWQPLNVNSSMFQGCKSHFESTHILLFHVTTTN